MVNGSCKEISVELMKKNNPIIIPRNHYVEEALVAANDNNLKPMNLLLSFLEKPYTNQNGIDKYQEPSNNTKYQTFCGT